MSLRVALNHKMIYTYDRLVGLGPQVVRLRPAPHSRTPILSYSLKVTPRHHFLNWQQDPQGNYLARLVFPEKTQEFRVEVDLVAELTVINPFDFFLEPAAEKFPFVYDAAIARELRPYLELLPVGPRLQAWLDAFSREPRRMIDALVEINQSLQKQIGYLIRMDPGVQTPEETLTKLSGSCRDTSWLMVQILRNLGLAARFVSGYSIQLVPDIKALDGPSGVAKDLTDLHAWAEVYLPGAGWVGLDPTSGLMTGEGHIPLAATPDPGSAAPIAGGVDESKSTFQYEMSVARIHEEPRVTKPYTEDQWADILRVGETIDRDLVAGDVRLTMGGEPTFVSIDDMEGAEWNTAAVGPTKRGLGAKLMDRLRTRFAPGGLLHYGMGKWYPGESLPRWAMACFWRKDGVAIWADPDLFAADGCNYAHGATDAQLFLTEVADRLKLKTDCVKPAYEDVWHYLRRERKLPINVDPLKSNLADKEERTRLAKIFMQGLNSIVGYTLPVQKMEAAGGPQWMTGNWFLREEHLYLIPGDSPMGLRLPLESLPWLPPEDYPHIHAQDPLAERSTLPNYAAQLAEATGLERADVQQVFERGPAEWRSLGVVEQVLTAQRRSARAEQAERTLHGNGLDSLSAERPHSGAGAGNGFNGNAAGNGNGNGASRYLAEAARRNREFSDDPSVNPRVRTALCVEPREGRLHVFMPPTETAEDYLELIAVIEDTAKDQQCPVVIEGYSPPHDHRITNIKVTPDPGVIEVNVHPSSSWKELVDITLGLYEDARITRLGTEKFNLDGRHTGTGGGNHVVVGGATPADSPLLRRPDLLRSLLAYWNNHPSLSYLFSGQFIGPTSQAPRVDEARNDSLYELEIAFNQLPKDGPIQPWLVDRLFRNLLIDSTGNTHRAEFCIDKMYSPDSSTGRLGLLELRGFEMPPHAQMSLAQQLLLRGLIAKFWNQPYQQSLVHWGTDLHDRYLLPHFVQRDFSDVIADLRQAGYDLKEEWFASHQEFRFPLIGEIVQRDIRVELRKAIEPWNVLGEEPAGGGTARYVDSSLERVQVKVEGMTDTRHVLTCNGRRVPLHPTGTGGESVAGIRYRAWQPPSCLHPTIPVHAPLVFDLVDSWQDRSLGGFTYHVAHPGGLSFATFPVNAYEAESRRGALFQKLGHTGGKVVAPPEECNCKFPMTLDLRR